jgi:hypothetical protein
MLRLQLLSRLELPLFGGFRSTYYVRCNPPSLPCDTAQVKRARCKCFGPTVHRASMCIFPIVYVYSVLIRQPAAVEANKLKIDLEGLRVYGILTDLSRVDFYSDALIPFGVDDYT